MGCYVDGPARDFSTVLYVGPPVIHTNCLKKAFDLKLKYVGLQNGAECWGDNVIGKYGKRPDEECLTGCVYEPGRTCGGPYRNKVYRVDRIGG